LSVADSAALIIFLQFPVEPRLFSYPSELLPEPTPHFYFQISVGLWEDYALFFVHVPLLLIKFDYPPPRSSFCMVIRPGPPFSIVSRHVFLFLYFHLLSITLSSRRGVQVYFNAKFSGCHSPDFLFSPPIYFLLIEIVDPVFYSDLLQARFSGAPFSDVVIPFHPGLCFAFSTSYIS